MNFLRKILLLIEIMTIIFYNASGKTNQPFRLDPVRSTQCNSQYRGNATIAVNEAIQKYLQSNDVINHCPCLNSTESASVAYFDMTDPSQQCPSNWSLNTDDHIRGCGIKRSGGGCDSVYYSVDGYSYNRVCGRIIGYQKGSTDAFNFYKSARGLEEPYVDGVSLTHGATGSRQHIWTFAVGLAELDTRVQVTCDCSNSNLAWPFQVPSYVGNNYFCETGNTGPGHTWEHIHSDDPLWDGKGCGPTSTCCQKNHPPWFCATLPQMTSDDLEVRICSDETRDLEDTIISFIELYVSVGQ